MRDDYFSDLLPESCTLCTQPKTEIVQPEKDKTTNENNKLPGPVRFVRFVRFVRQKNNNTEEKQEITQQHEEVIRAWLHFIGETDLALINEVINKCCADSLALNYFLWRAEEVPAETSPITYGQKQCITCTHWRGNRCQAPQHRRRNNDGRLLVYTPDPLEYWRCDHHSAQQIFAYH